MAEDGGHRERYRAVEQMKVRVADPAVADSHHHLTRLRHLDVDVVEHDEVGIGSLHERGPHARTPSFGQRRRPTENRTSGGGDTPVPRMSPDVRIPPKCLTRRGVPAIGSNQPSAGALRARLGATRGGSPGIFG